MLPDYINAYLICPECGSGDIVPYFTEYICAKCGKSYPDDNDIPDFTVMRKAHGGQSRRSKEGEIEFRKKLVEQEVLNKTTYFKGMPDNLDNLLRDWIKPQIEDLEFIIKILNIHSDALMLELGCEYSHCTSHLYNRGKKVIGGDLSRECLFKAPPVLNRKLGYKRLPPVMSFDATNLPFMNNTFDFIFCFAFVHHFPDLRELSREVSRVLKQGGYFTFAWEPLIPLKVITKLKHMKFGDFHEVSYGIHEGLYNFLDYYFGFIREFKPVVGNPWTRWKENERYNNYKRLKGIAGSLYKNTDGFGMILKKR